MRGNSCVACRPNYNNRGLPPEGHDAEDFLLSLLPLGHHVSHQRRQSALSSRTQGQTGAAGAQQGITEGCSRRHRQTPERRRSVTIAGAYCTRAAHARAVRSCNPPLPVVAFWLSGPWRRSPPEPRVSIRGRRSPPTCGAARAPCSAGSAKRGCPSSSATRQTRVGLRIPRRVGRMVCQPRRAPRHRRAPAAHDTPSVAVLPFADLSPQARPGLLLRRDRRGDHSRAEPCRGTAHRLPHLILPLSRRRARQPRRRPGARRSLPPRRQRARSPAIVSASPSS